MFSATDWGETASTVLRGNRGDSAGNGMLGIGLVASWLSTRSAGVTPEVDLSECTLHFVSNHTVLLPPKAVENMSDCFTVTLQNCRTYQTLKAGNHGWGFGATVLGCQSRHL